MRKTDTIQSTTRVLHFKFCSFRIGLSKQQFITKQISSLSDFAPSPSAKSLFTTIRIKTIWNHLTCLSSPLSSNLRLEEVNMEVEDLELKAIHFGRLELHLRISIQCSTLVPFVRNRLRIEQLSLLFPSSLSCTATTISSYPSSPLILCVNMSYVLELAF